MLRLESLRTRPKAQKEKRMRKPGVAVSSGLAFALAAGIASQSVVSLRSQVRPASAVATAEGAMDALRERLGAAPVECGRYEKPVRDEFPVAASVQCVIEAATRGRQAWTIVYGPDAGWRVARGVFSGSDGVVREFTFD